MAGVIATPTPGAPHSRTFAVTTAGIAITAVRIAPVARTTTAHHTGMHHAKTCVVAASESHSQFRIDFANPKKMVKVLLGQLGLCI